MRLYFGPKCGNNGLTVPKCFCKLSHKHHITSSPTQLKTYCTISNCLLDPNQSVFVYITEIFSIFGPGRKRVAELSVH